MTRQRVFGIAGWKNSGKTLLVTRLVAEFTRRGYRVSTVKHAHHSFDVDTPDTDSYRHRQAGASEVALVSSNRFALMHELRDEDEPTLEDILGRMAPCDLILIEGYKRAGHAKIEARRTEAAKSDPLAAQDPSIVAIAADHPVADTSVPVFDLDDIGAIADFIAEQTQLEDRDGDG